MPSVGRNDELSIQQLLLSPLTRLKVVYGQFFPEFFCNITVSDFIKKIVVHALEKANRKLYLSESRPFIQLCGRTPLADVPVDGTERN